MRRTSVAVTAAAVLWVLSAASWAQEEQWLQYRTSREPERSGAAVRWLEVSFSDEAPGGAALPDFKAYDVRFAWWATPMDKNGRRLLAIDRSRGGDGPYDALYVDSNGDGGLADEKPVMAYAALPTESRFEGVKVVFKGPDGPVASHLNVTCYNHPQRKGIMLSSAGWYEGKVTVGGREYQCRLVDYNSNGAYDDASMDFNEADRIWMDAGAGFFESFAGKYILVDAKYYRSEAARDGAFVTFTPAANLPLGTLRVHENVRELSVGGENGLIRLEITDGAAEVPAGKWRVNYWGAAREDETGAKWVLRGWGFAAGGELEVAEGAEEKIEIGGAIISGLTAGKNEGEWVFAEELKGALGERIDITRNNSRPEPPKLRIKNEDGSYDRVYSFQYG